MNLDGLGYLGTKKLSSRHVGAPERELPHGKYAKPVGTFPDFRLAGTGAYQIRSQEAVHTGR